MQETLQRLAILSLADLADLADFFFSNGKVFTQSCHFEEREIFASNSTKIDDILRGVSHEDFSFLEMTNFDYKKNRSLN
ncbi:hypothetical protein GCM10022422_43440 [Flavobacterium ginsengisoli]|uniref:SnoaL-like domain-containing protein n=1 Tax=Flavobacterium ginsengisoli TaxID=871694 RepID=A0ABP7G708_9FLAO